MSRRPGAWPAKASADETFFLGSFEGKKQGIPRAPHKRGSKASERGLSAEQVPVRICRDRTGSMSDFVLGKADKARICAAPKLLLAADSRLKEWMGRFHGIATHCLAMILDDEE